MVMVKAFDEAKAQQRKIEPDAKRGPGTILNTPFFGVQGAPNMYELPLACLSQGGPGRSSTAHFHVVDQFQFVVDGKGTLGRHQLTPYGVHFSRAYTPYGPLATDPEVGLTYFVLRAHHDTGAQRLPEEREQLMRNPHRRPLQMTRQVMFPALPTEGTAPGVKLDEIPGMKDDAGLAAYALSMQPDTKTQAPDPRGEGQYIVAVQGSFWHDDKEYKAWALVFTGPKEGPFRIHAGAQGLQALIVNFPQVNAPAAAARPAAGTGGTAGLKETLNKGAKPPCISPTSREARFAKALNQSFLKTWQCALCLFVYDEARGLPEEGIAPGTRWQDVPDNWSCPDCSASKSDFQMTAV